MLASQEMDVINLMIYTPVNSKLLSRVIVFFTLCACLMTPFTSAHEDKKSAVKNQLGVINYCVDPSWQPYEGLENNKHVGLSSDYLDYFANYTGMKLKLIQTSSWLETLELLKNGTCHLTPMLNESEKRKHYLSFSETYFTAPNVLVSLRDQPFLQDLAHVENRSVAIVKGYRLIDYIQEYFPNIELTFVENEQEGLNLVASHQVDLFIGSMLSVHSNIIQEGLSQLKIAGWAGPEDRLKLAVIKSKQALIPDINKAIASIAESRRLEIYRKWHNIELVETVDYDLWWKSIAVATVLFFAVMIWNRAIYRYSQELKEKNASLNQLKVELELANKKLKFSANHDPLTQLYNRQYFNEKLSQEHRQHKEGVTLIIIDIDYFKAINDKYGHIAGDQILMVLSKILTKQLRESDLLARWGGEEFVIVSKQSNLDSAKYLCSRIKKAINDYTFPYCKELSCSFGIAEHQSKENILDCFERADQALYQAKKQGRNQICCAQT